MRDLVEELTAGIRSPTAAERARAADETTDVVRSLTREEADSIGCALIRARLVESDADAQESQLHALGELVEWHDHIDFSNLHYLPRPTGDPSQDQYLAYLLDGER